MTTRKFLIINVFGIGDVLFTTPMIRNIKENVPGSFIGYVCNKRALDVLRDNPAIDRFHVYERDDFKAMSRGMALRELVRFLRDIKGERYDIVFHLSLNRYASLFTWMSGIPRRHGFAYKNRSLFLTARVPMNGYTDKHVVEYYLDLLQGAGIPVPHKKLEVHISDPDREWARRLLGEEGLKPDDLVIGLVPGGGASWGGDARYRRWMPERHAQLADKIIEKYGAKVILMGDSSETDLGEKVLSVMRHRPLNMIGRTTLGQYLALLERCRLAVLNDGGPLHMAVAAGVKTVSLIATVDERVYGPYPPQGHEVVTNNIACRPCYRNFRHADCEHISCLNGIRVDDVMARVEKAVAGLKSKERVTS